MSGSKHLLKVSQELIKNYTHRRNSHLVSATGDGEHSEEPDPYAFNEGDEEFSFTEKKDKLGAEREGTKKYKVGFWKDPAINCIPCQTWVSSMCVFAWKELFISRKW